MGVGEIALEKIEVIGPAISDLAVPFKLPADPLKLAEELDNIEVVVGEACSGCLNRLGEVFMALGKEKLAQSGEITFVVGKGVEPRPGRANILLGVCTAAHREKGIYLPRLRPHVGRRQASHSIRRRRSERAGLLLGHGGDTDRLIVTGGRGLFLGSEF